jgi:plasmid stability protein
MAQLIVRNLEETLVKALKITAARNGRSAEAEHREILRAALRPKSPAPTLKDVLLEMPSVGEDRDFARLRDVGRRTRL